MNKMYKKALTAIASGALLFNTVLPAFAETTIEISGNGTDSENEVKLDVDQVTSVVQDNFADIDNKVVVHADTGDNTAEDNTGGAVSIETGDATATVDVANTANSNTASVDCCPAGDVDILIKGNAADTDENEVKLDIYSKTELFQDNQADIFNGVEVEAETGENDAEDNTGGDVSIKTGDATVGVTLSTAANYNSAQVSGSGSGGKLSARILDNGADSENEIELDVDKFLSVIQDNFADVDNFVDAEAYTGDNDAEDNTGGEASIETGDAKVTVGIDNMVNFNWADVDCGGCLMEVLAKIAGNAAHSENEIKAYLDDMLSVFQTNSAASGELDNGVGVEAETGDATVGVDIENSGNANVYGEMPEFELPEWLGGGFSINISLDLSALLTLLGLA